MGKIGAVDSDRLRLVVVPGNDLEAFLAQPQAEPAGTAEQVHYPHESYVPFLPIVKRLHETLTLGRSSRHCAARPRPYGRLPWLALADGNGLDGRRGASIIGTPR